MADGTQPGFTRPESNPAGTGHDQQEVLRGEGSDDPKPETFEKVSRDEAHLRQYPSLYGQVGVEVVERTSDAPSGGRASRKHRKVYVIWTGDIDFDPASFDHNPNFTATRQYMLDHGLRPVGDVSFVGAEPVDANNTALTYEVEALPAVVATEPATAHMVVSQD